MKLTLTILMGLSLLIGCGNDPSGDDPPDVIIHQPPAPPPTPPPGPPEPKPVVWAGDIQNLVKQNCALSGCHAGAGFVTTEGAFKASAAAQVISNGRMPPRYSPNYESWSDEKKLRILKFLGAVD